MDAAVHTVAREDRGVAQALPVGVVPGAHDRTRDPAPGRAAQDRRRGHRLPDPAVRARDVPGIDPLTSTCSLCSGTTSRSRTGCCSRCWGSWWPASSSIACARCGSSGRPRDPKDIGAVMTRVPRRSPASRAPRVSAVGVDTGGTFTDVVARTHGGLVTLKVASTPSEPHRATLEGLSRVGAKSGTRVRYGSTLATNTLLERSGARVTLVTTEGFEDVIEIGRQDRPDIYSLSPRRVPPLVPAERRIGARERRGPHGERWRALTPAEIARVVRRVRRTGPEAIAIGLLHAYADASHERRLARALKTLGVPVTTSSDLCPEIREVERLATTVTNAYIEPRVHANLTRIARGTRARVEVVLSHGGTGTDRARGARAGAPAAVRSRGGPARGAGRRARVRLRAGADDRRRRHVDRLRLRPRRAAAAARARSRASRCCCRCSTCTRSAPAVDRSRASTPVAYSTSDRRARGEPRSRVLRPRRSTDAHRRARDSWVAFRARRSPVAR